MGGEHDIRGDEGVGQPGYEIFEVLGRGGFATVHRARQLSVDREVALRIDGRRLLSDRDRRRFLREVTAAGRLSDHPNVVAVHDAGVREDGRPYLVLELCPGGSLADRLSRTGPLPIAEARDIGVALADALAAAHAAGVLHRDIKPGNVMINRYGGVALTDFGLAALPRPGHDLSVTREALTPAYAPPEAFRLAEPSAAGDVYSLAATVHALLCGRPPHFPADGGTPSLAELIVRHTGPLPDLAGVPAGLMAVLRRALAADPAERTADAGEFRDALAAVDLGGTPAGPAPAGFGPAPVMAPGPVPAGPPAPGGVPPYAPGSAGSPPAAAGDGAGAVTAPEAGPDTRPARRRGPLLAAVAASVVLAVGAGAGLTLLMNGDGAGDGDAADPLASAPPADGRPAEGEPAGDGRVDAPEAGDEAPTTAVEWGVPTTTEDCPAADIEGADAACVTEPECWGGMVVITGNVSITAADCRTEHVWETFAIAPLPADGATHNQSELAAHPTVRELCSAEVLAASLNERGRGRDADSWEPDVLPPTEAQYVAGSRVLRCVAASIGSDGSRLVRPHFGAADAG